MSPPHEKQNGPSYVKALYDQGIIEKEQVTFWLNKYKDDDSYITLGEAPANSTVGQTWTQDLYSRYD